MTSECGYSGTEPAVAYTDNGIAADEMFELRSPRIPASALPIYDETLHAIVGYRSRGSVVSYYDLDGNVVGMDEPGLETPLIDPIDLLFLAGGIFKVFGRAAVMETAEVASKTAVVTASRLSVRSLATAFYRTLVAAFRRVPIRALQFTETTAARMATEGRRVPIHILHLAIRFGVRVADREGVEGAFMYTIRILRNGKPYLLEVVVRESDWTILHFLYR